ncbi:MAG: monovalent cation/H(+) antiporter subunit G [Chloroflexota bacterium]
METVLQLLAFLLLVLGTLFSLIGVIGFIRLPDVYTRLHATGKVSVFGLVFLLLAADILTPLATWKALLLIFFVLAASPAVAHAISSSAYRTGVPLVGKRDDLKGKLEVGQEKD